MPDPFQPSCALLPEVERRLHSTLVAELLVTGIAPSVEQLAKAVELDSDDVRRGLFHLVEAGYASFDATGQLTGAYPISAIPTPIIASIGDRRRYVACVVDALGIATMLGRTVAIEGSCVICGQPIHIAAHASGATTAEPATTVAVSYFLPNALTAPSLSSPIAFLLVCGPVHAHAFVTQTPEAETLPLAQARTIGEEMTQDLFADELPAIRQHLEEVDDHR
jgi:hypothetical protein